MERRFVLASLVGIFIVTSFFTLNTLNRLIQIEEEKKLYGTIYEVTEYSEVNYLLFDNHNNLSLYSRASTFVENSYYSLCYTKDMYETFLHTVSLSDDLSEIDSIQVNKIMLNPAKYGFRSLASNGSHFWTLQRVPCTSYESVWYDFRLIGFSQNEGLFLNYTLPVNNFPEFPNLEQHAFDSIRYWGHKLYLKGLIIPYNSSGYSFIIKLNLSTLDYESIIHEESFLPINFELRYGKNMEIDNQGRIWVIASHVSDWNSADSETWDKIHSYDLENWKIESTIIFKSWWFPEGDFSIQEENLADKYGKIDFDVYGSIEGISLEANLRKVIFSLEIGIYDDIKSWQQRYVGLRINFY